MSRARDHEESGGIRTWRACYRAAWWLVAPIAVLRLLWRSRREPGYRAHIGERFGFGGRAYKDDGRSLIWIHAVSVGETRAAQPLIDALQAARPDLRVLLTHMTPAGRATGESLFGERVLRSYLPYDTPCAVRRFLRRYRPAAGALIETEVWPTLIDECARAGMPLALVNARMSERSSRRAARFGAAARTVFGGFARVFAQTPADAARLTALGAREVAVLGNLKFDISPAPALIARGHRWRAALGSRPVWVAASTREGEEQLVLDAFARLALAANGQPDALLILVPRHPQRFDAVAALLERGGWRVERRSLHGVDGMREVPAGTQVVLGDSMGELAAYYAAADIAFIGGSLLPLGGQNLIEACAAGVPVLIGPHTFNFARATEDAIAAGAALRVANPTELAARLIDIFGNAPRRAAMAEAAKTFADAHKGATARTVKRLLELADSSRARSGTATASTRNRRAS